jgi:hypothetical protein
MGEGRIMKFANAHLFHIMSQLMQLVLVLGEAAVLSETKPSPASAGQIDKLLGLGLHGLANPQLTLAHIPSFYCNKSEILTKNPPAHEWMR